MKTDTLVQQTIRDAFTDSTIITIAHRLNTIIDFDKVIVMDKGSVAEFDKPAKLLADDDTLFSKLVDSTGESSAAELRKRAAASMAQEEAGEGAAASSS